jgi:hypothetical protein
MSLFQYITLFVIILFIIFYNIWRHNKNVDIALNWPIIAMLPSVLHNQSNIHDYATLVLKHYGGTFHFKGPWFTNIANFILTSDLMNVHHILSKNISAIMRKDLISMRFLKFLVLVFSIWIPMNGNNCWNLIRRFR